MRRRWIWLVVGLPVLIAAWWAFRPERLWINHKVNEPAPFASRSAMQPLAAGQFSGVAHPTSGRAAIYEAAGGVRVLRLTDFPASGCSASLPPRHA